MMMNHFDITKHPTKPGVWCVVTWEESGGDRDYVKRIISTHTGRTAAATACNQLRQAEGTEP